LILLSLSVVVTRGNVARSSVFGQIKYWRLPC